MKFRKKQIVIDAAQWNGDKASFDAILSLGLEMWSPGEMGSNTFYVQTLEGLMLVNEGDWIIRGIAGEFYPCKPAIFKASYEPLDLK